MKHLFTALLLLCTTVASAHDFEVYGIYYNITDATNKTVSVTYKGNYYNSYNEYTGSVVIPKSVAYNGTTYSVTSIGDAAFCGCTGLTSIEIPNSVTSIGSSAFEDCAGLTSIEIPNSVTSIGWEAFSGCTGLTSIEIPNSVTSIVDYAFRGCTGLTSIEIPNSVTSIGSGAFSGCSNVETLYIGSSVASIGGGAFAGCEKITEIKVALEKPIRGSANIFAEAAYDNATLYVPTGTEPLYQKLEPWNIFFNIVEMDFTGIDEVLDDVETESVKQKGICYDLNGRVVENPSKGMYIINGKKVLIK